MPQSDKLVFSSSSDPDELPLSIAHPADGRALRYHADELAITWIAAMSESIACMTPFVEASRVFDREMLSLHVENLLHRRLLDVCRAYTRRHYLKLIGHASAKPVECPAELFELVRTHWPDGTIPVVPRRQVDPLLRRADSLLLRVREAFWRMTKPLPPAAPRHPMIAVELVEGGDPLRKSDAYWLVADIVPARQVLQVLERHNKFFLDVEQELAHASRLGSRCVALHPSVSANGRVPLWVPPRMPGWLRQYCASVGGGSSALDRWLRRALKEFARSVWRWEAFFRHFNVVIYQQFTEASLDTAPRRLAIDRVGGIEVGKMRSQFFDRSSAGFYFQHEVAFVWHHNAAAFLEHGRTRTSRVVAVGYPWDHLFTAMVEDASAIRQRLMKPGISLVLTVYDNYGHVNGVCSTEQVQAFYTYLVGLAQSHSNIALLVKSKKPQILRQMREIAVALKQLEAEGRCLVLDEPLASVVPAALAADLVVAIPAGTAGCEAVLGGRPVLMYDPAGSRDHALNGDDKGIVHDDFARFCSALDAALGAPRAVGCAQAQYADMIDPFRDGGAARRTAAFLSGFLDAKRLGLGKEAALKAADKRYREASTRSSSSSEPSPPAVQMFSESNR